MFFLTAARYSRAPGSIYMPDYMLAAVATSTVFVAASPAFRQDALPPLSPERQRRQSRFVI